MSLKKNLFLLCILCLVGGVVTGCLPDQERLEEWQIEEWRQDLDYLEKELPEKHVDLFFNLSEQDFNGQIESLKSRLNELNEDETVVELSKIITAVGDEHTGINIAARKMFPIELMWLKDGWYVVNTAPEYQHLIYSRLIAINGHDIQEVEEQLSLIISHSNQSWLKSQMKYYFVLKAALHGLGLIGSGNKVEFTFEDSDGEIIKEKVKTKDGRTVLEDIFQQTGKDENSPLFMKNSERNYWYEILEEYNIIYFKYNVCEEDDEVDFDEFIQELMGQIEAHESARLVIDLRDNQGGDSSLLDPFIDFVSTRSVNQQGKLYVITGRRTFSSAVLNTVRLKLRTEALFLGEPTGGKPIHYGEFSFFRLPNSKTTVKYSTKYFTHFMDGDVIREVPFKEDSFYPDILLEAGINDYREKRDVVLEYIINHD